MHEVAVPTEDDARTNDLRVAARGPEPRRPADIGRRLSELPALTAQARSEFGVRCFWNVPALTDPIEDARLVAVQLRKYGGRPGWAVASDIDRALRGAAGSSDGVDPVPAGGAAASRP